MELSAAVQIAVFSLFSLIGVGGALGMTTTMSMFRSAIFLMASFIGIAGLFILLMADLLGMLQIMMYIGGMLVMALFMVLLSSDPGGEMMASKMKMPPLERFFSRGLSRDDPGDHAEMSPMFTPAKKAAAVMAHVAGAGLLSMVLLSDPWPVSRALPDQDSSRRIGHLLMGKYMIAFEGAGLLILLGIFGAVWASRPGRHPDPTDRDRLKAAVDEPPAAIDEEEA